MLFECSKQETLVSIVSRCLIIRVLACVRTYTESSGVFVYTSVILIAQYRVLSHRVGNDKDLRIL
jgi:hypothetical protein